MEIFLQTEAWIALLTLTLLEVVLGIDNIIFISLLSNKLPKNQQQKARITGLAGALIMRVVLLLTVSWIISFSNPLFSVFGTDISIRDIILLAGGLFLIAKSTSEIHHKLEDEVDSRVVIKSYSFFKVVMQVIILDIVFSFDSILTAIGMTKELLIMIIAVCIAICIMMFMAKTISRFINANPTLQMLALSFLILIGVMLILESFGKHIEKGYIYFAVFFSLSVELLNIRLRKKKI